MELLTISLVFTNLLLLLDPSSASYKDPTKTFLDCLTKLQFQTNFSSSQTPNPKPTTSPLKPLLTLTPAHVSDVQASIRCAKQLGIHIRTRSGGHDYEGLSSTSRGLDVPFVVVDMRNLSSITIDNASKTAWVQTGATVGQLYYALHKNNQTLTFPAGLCPTVGIGGHLSGGGYGMLARMHGLASDHIVDATLIDANGDILDRGSMGEDVFWALGGGGSASFGIILAFKIDLVVVPEIITPFIVERKNPSTQLIDRWQHVADKVDERLMLRVTLGSGKNRTIVATFVALYLGRANDLLSYMGRVFPELGLVEKECKEMSWIESVLYFASLGDQPLEALLGRTPQGPYTPAFYKGKSDFVKNPIPINGFERIERFLDEEGDYKGAMELSPFGGQLSNFSESRTPFPHRAGNMYMIRYGVVWEKEGDEEKEKHLSWMRRLYGYMERYVTKSPRAAYFNYKDLDIGMNDGNGNASYNHASVWGRKYYKNNFERLVRAKTQVDPSNFFRNEQSIPLLT